MLDRTNLIRHSQIRRDAIIVGGVAIERLDKSDPRSAKIGTGREAKTSHSRPFLHRLDLASQQVAHWFNGKEYEACRRKQEKAQKNISNLKMCLDGRVMCLAAGNKETKPKIKSYVCTTVRFSIWLRLAGSCQQWDAFLDEAWWMMCPSRPRQTASRPRRERSLCVAQGLSITERTNQRGKRWSRQLLRHVEWNGRGMWWC